MNPPARTVLVECVKTLISDVPRLMHVAAYRRDEQGANCERVARELLAKAMIVCDLIKAQEAEDMREAA